LQHNAGEARIEDGKEDCSGEGRGSIMGKRKTPEELADIERRYERARNATTALDFEELSRDPHQGIRNVAVMSPHADAAALALFATDPFWSVRIAVAEHANVTREILLRLLESDPRKRGVVDHAARKRLTAEGMTFEDN
jgi:hypothetical protein